MTDPRTPKPEWYIEMANKWNQRAEEHIRAADFCHDQATRFMGKIAVEADFRPTLTLIQGGSDG